MYNLFMALTEVWYIDSLFYGGNEIMRFRTWPNAILSSGSAKASFTAMHKN
jgi:hypothetical protein